LLPKIHEASNGIWDGTKVEDKINQNRYNTFRAIGLETGKPIIVELLDEYEENGKTYYSIRFDSYASMGQNYGFEYMTFTLEDYKKIQAYQDENNVQIIYPAVDKTKFIIEGNRKPAYVWYQHDKKGNPIVDSKGNYTNIYQTNSSIDDQYTSKMRIAGDDGSYKYANYSGTSSYECRVNLYNYFIYLYGTEPLFVFGTDAKGFDILTRLASGARLSFVLSFFVASINLIIGAIWGSIAGYYGGTTDLIMERITDILGNVPFMVVTTLFQLHLASKVGAVPSLLFAFVTTGWIGTASTVRMQFYRYKNQEYIMAARTLGAKDSRLMFKHIFPNALGTIITSSILIIPSTILSETTLSYLGIVNFQGATSTSLGTMLANGKEYLSTDPHIIAVPAIAISLLMISFNLFGNGLRDAFNPSLRGVEE
jgi:oligopeptide transport system permease protein